MTVFKFLWLSSPEATPDDRLFYQEAFSYEICPVQHGNSSPGFLLSGHPHEGNTSRLASLPGPGKLDRYDISSFGEKGFRYGWR